MLPRAQEQDGFLMIEVVAAIMIISIALLALMAGYDSAFFSLHKSSQKAVAATLANQQLELYSALPYASIGLNSSLVNAVGDSTKSTYDSLYATNTILDGTKTDPVTGQQVANNGTQNDVTASVCASDTTDANCIPIQTVTGTDGRSYRIETFVVDTSNTESDESNIRWTTRDVSVIVRDPTNDDQIVSEQTAFDRAAAG